MGECCSLGNENKTFLRTSEFLGKKRHTAHITKEEALEEAEQMLEIYAEFAGKMMAVLCEGLEISKREICRSR